MELRQLHYFVTLAEELHFGRAAAREHVVPSALSQQIQRLERELGVVLVDRNTHYVRLTRPGSVLLTQARGVLGEVERAVIATQRADASAAVARVAIGDASLASPPQVLRHVQYDNPELVIHRIEASVPEQYRMLHEARLDIGVTPIGISFFVDVPVETSTITFTVSGIEDDPIFDNTIAGFTRTFGQPEDWGQGFQTGSASDSKITYTLNYTITCARDAVVAVSRAALLGYARAKAEQRRVDVPTEHIGIAWALDRMGREGWQVVAATDTQYVLRGPGTLPLLAERMFGGGGRG